MKHEKKRAALWATLAGFVVAFGLYAGAAWAQLVIQYDASGIVANTATLRFLDDGGCVLSTCGTAVSTDGGNLIQICANNYNVTRPAFLTRCEAFQRGSQVVLSAQLGTGSDGGVP